MQLLTQIFACANLMLLFCAKEKKCFGNRMSTSAKNSVIKEKCLACFKRGAALRSGGRGCTFTRKELVEISPGLVDQQFLSTSGNR